MTVIANSAAATRVLRAGDRKPLAGHRRVNALLKTSAIASTLFVFLAMPKAALAQAVWGGAGSTTTTNDYNLGTNWSTNLAPTAAATSAQFGDGTGGAGGTASPTVTVTAGPITPDSWTFLANSQSYTVTGQAVNFGNAATLTNNANAGQAISISNNMTGTTLSQAGASTLTISGTNSFTNTSVSAGTLINNGSLTSTNTIGVTGTAVFTNNLTVTGAVNNGATSTFNNNAPGTVSGTVTNSGTGTNSGTIASLSNTGGTFGNSGTISGGATISGGTLTTTGTINGGLTNSATVNAQNQVNGAILNQGAGVFTVSGTLAGNNTFTNNGTAQLAVTGGNFTGITTLTNNSTNANGIVVATGDTLSAANISNSTGAFIQNSGTLTATTGPVGNAGTLNNLLSTSIINGGLSNTAGTTNNTGTINGGVSVTGGTLNTNTATSIVNGGLTNSATVNAQNQVNGAILNQGAGVFTVSGTLAGNNTFTNNGTAQLAVTGGNFTGITTLTNNSTNATGISVSAGKLLSANVITNAANATISVTGTLTAASGLFTNSGALNVNAGGIVNATSGGLTNTATGTIANYGTVNDALNNAGTVTNNLTYNADVATNTGTITNSATGTWTGNVISNASNTTGITNNGVWVGNVQANTGTINNNLTWTGSITSSGTFNNNAPGTVSGLVTNSGTGTNSGILNGGLNNSGSFANTGTVNSGLTNSGTYRQTAGSTNGSTTNTGTINASGSGFTGAIANNTAGAFNITGGTVTANSTFTNNNTATLSVTGGNFTGITTLTNNSTNTNGVVVGTGKTLSAANISNSAGAFIQNSGTLTGGAGGITNVGMINNLLAGSIINTGAGGLSNNGGTINAQGAINGVINNNAGGVFNVTPGALAENGSAFNNNAGAVSNVGGQSFTGVGTYTNAGTTNIGSGGTIGATTFTNTGALIVTGLLNSVATAGTFNNNAGGSINLGGATASPTTPALTVGSYNGAAGSSITDPINLNLGVTNRNAILATGSISGVAAVNFQQTGGGATGIFPVITPTGAATATAAGTGLSNSGFVNYSFVAPGGQNNPTANYSVVGVPNPGASLSPLTSILASVASIDAAFHQPGGQLVASPQTDQTGLMVGGPWVRASSGTTTISSTGTETGLGGQLTANTRVRETFSGVQAGADSGWLNVGGSGANAHFGITGGQVEANATDLINAGNSVTFEVPFVGVYGVMTKGPLSADLSYRHSWYDMTVTTFSNSALVLNRAPLNGEANNINGSLAYQISLPKNWFIEPTANASYTVSTFNNLPIPSASATMMFNDVTSMLVRAGARFGTSFQGGGFNWTPFGLVMALHEFETTAGGSVVQNGNTFGLSTDRVGTFYQVSGGIAATALTNGLLGFVRADYRFGDKLNGSAIVGGLRYTFGPFTSNFGAAK